MYSIVYGESLWNASAFEAGVELALRELPQPAHASGRPGLGFVVCHQGCTGDYIVLSWWDRENELPIRVFVREGESWRPARDSESVCVWDLEVIWHERCAYVETMLREDVAQPDEEYFRIVCGRS